MTVQDFIVNYNQTFIYLHEKYGKSYVVELWKTLSREFGYNLEKVVADKGLKGYFEFFYGDDGTAARELVIGEARYDEKSGFYERIDQCPSIQSLVDQGKRIYRYYCEHCYWLYAYSLEKHGYHYEATYWLQKEGNPINYCLFGANDLAKLSHTSV
jgi:hypothetical protein